MFAFLLQLRLSKNSHGAYLLLKEHGVDGLPTGQDHHGESHSHRHHETHSNHLRDQIGREVHEDISSNVLRETYVTKEPHLGQREGNHQGGRLLGCESRWASRWVAVMAVSESVCTCCSAHGDVEDGDNVES